MHTLKLSKVKTAITSFNSNIKTLFNLKLLLYITVGIFISVPYYLIQQINFTNITKMPTWKIDELIGFNSEYIWIYNSLHLFIIMVTFRYSDKKKLLQYTKGVVLIATISFAIFLIFPTEAVRPSSQNTSWFYQFLIRIDGTTNAFPSLHVSLALFALYSLIKDQKNGIIGIIIYCVWCSAIIFSTLATKQHVFIDIIGGILLAFSIVKILELKNKKHAKKKRH